MLIEVLKSKIHRVALTQADLNYVGSIAIDEGLMEAANLIVGEKVQVLNINNGERLETYVIKGPREQKKSGRTRGFLCHKGPRGRRLGMPKRACSPSGRCRRYGDHCFIRH